MLVYQPRLGRFHTWTSGSGCFPVKALQGSSRRELLTSAGPIRSASFQRLPIALIDAVEAKTPRRLADLCRSAWHTHRYRYSGNCGSAICARRVWCAGCDFEEFGLKRVASILKRWRIAAVSRSNAKILREQKPGSIPLVRAQIHSDLRQQRQGISAEMAYAKLAE
jgi:hypothetical protein